jgi:hypothetical protein
MRHCGNSAVHAPATVGHLHRVTDAGRGAREAHVTRLRRLLVVELHRLHAGPGVPARRVVGPHAPRRVGVSSAS